MRADLAYHGYPYKIEGTPPGNVNYIYEHASATGPYTRPFGTYTRYGDVTPLLQQVDDMDVIFGTGEDIDLEFNAVDQPALPQGWVRDYFFYANGFEKDLDFYAAHAFTVEPLPRHGLDTYPYPEDHAYPADDEHLRYQLEYNTRARSDRLPGNLRYSYPSEK